MRLLLIVISVLAVSSTLAAAGFLDKTPKEAADDAGSWIDSLFDAHVTVGDIIVYIIIAGFVFLMILAAGHASSDDIDEETRRRKKEMRQRQQDQDDSEMAIKPRYDSKAPYRDPWRSYDD